MAGTVTDTVRTMRGVTWRVAELLANAIYPRTFFDQSGVLLCAIESAFLGWCESRPTPVALVGSGLSVL